MNENKAAFGFDSMYDDDNPVVPDLSDHFSAESKHQRAAQDKAENAKFQAEQRQWFAAVEEQRNEVKRIQAQVKANKAAIMKEQALLDKFSRDLTKYTDADRAQCAKYIKILVDENKAFSTKLASLTTTTSLLKKIARTAIQFLQKMKITAETSIVEDLRDLAEIDAYERRYQD